MRRFISLTSARWFLAGKVCLPSRLALLPREPRAMLIIALLFDQIGELVHNRRLGSQRRPHAAAEAKQVASMDAKLAQMELKKGDPSFTSRQVVVAVIYHGTPTAAGDPWTYLR